MVPPSFPPIGRNRLPNVVGMKISILGTGNMASALAQVWIAAGHTVTVAGRSADKTAELARQVGATAASPGQAAAGADAVVMAVSWDGVPDMIELAGGSQGALRGVPVIDCTNPLDYGTGVHRMATGSTAELIAEKSGADVVKALHLYAGQMWLTKQEKPRVVTMCGDDEAALEIADRLVTDLGGTPATIGGLSRARQLEETAGVVFSLYSQGIAPATAMP
ncbi:MAG: NAD(P)-binding domain-containing protein [Hamadaea sp.]|uniref:NADPH-dependent F420 reductase n=1 Tax=Hamadaea sp. TaxID=2024425 RepID=UPI001802A411|nr:NAD(P)-binding domain-containing protein [Hamadaea sp.]NUT21805.1 NAD(P)-binding domain-containing protein [Hamadaea sp.]